MRPIHSETVAKAMIRAANENLEKNIFESNEIDELNKWYYFSFKIFLAGSVFFTHDLGIVSIPFKAAK